MGGGGGAGAFRIGTNLSVTPDDDYTITVGGGGAGSPGGVSAARGTPGDNSSIAGPSPFTTFTSTGGGAGGSNQQARLGGGSGGGGGGKGQPTVETGGAAETITPITDETTPSVVQTNKAGFDGGSSSGVELCCRWRWRFRCCRSERIWH
ncbi:MAG: hypothetical protein CM15mV83_400 [uncultured marine virus]|nr:MAG: hypothetical protein CM15mV83_400 [uncultured marine virus]